MTTGARKILALCFAASATVAACVNVDGLFDGDGSSLLNTGLDSGLAETGPDVVTDSATAMPDAAPDVDAGPVAPGIFIMEIFGATGGPFTGKYIEVANLTDAPVPLAGYEVRVGGLRAVKIGGPDVLAPGAYVLLLLRVSGPPVVDSLSSTSCGDYAAPCYRSVEDLPSTKDVEIALYAPGQTVPYDKTTYPGAASPFGASESWGRLPYDTTRFVKLPATPGQPNGY